MFCFAQWLLRPCPAAVRGAVQGTLEALSFVLPQHGRPSAASGHPAPGTLSLTPGTARSLKHQLQQGAHCSQSWGKEGPLLEGLCHLTGKPKSSPRARLHLQSIPAGRRADHSCFFLLAAARPPGNPPQQGWEGRKNLLRMCPHTPQTKCPGTAGSSGCSAHLCCKPQGRRRLERQL